MHKLLVVSYWEHELRTHHNFDYNIENKDIPFSTTLEGSQLPLPSYKGNSPFNLGEESNLLHS
jgi:hypothetical protein